MSNRFDVIVVGVGAMGAATCFYLAKRGIRVLGLEQFNIPNDLSSHHGQSRVIRKAYFEHPDYVPLLQRAYANWTELEHYSGLNLMHRVGGLYLGRPEGELIAGSLRAMQLHGLPYEQLTRQEVASRYIQFCVPDDFVGLFDPDTGFLDPELVVGVYAEQALRYGADLRGCLPVRQCDRMASGFRVLAGADVFEAERIIFCGGAWASGLLGQVEGLGNVLDGRLVVTRQVMAWLWPRMPKLFAYGEFPVWVIDDGSAGIHYGVPLMPHRPGFKIAYHKPASQTDPIHVDRQLRPEDEQVFRPVLEQFIPDANGPLLSMDVCLYTNSSDGHFIIDLHPDDDRVVIACGFSGHGFKFASVMGEALSDLVEKGKTDLPIGFLGLSRFG